jgi:hypothetical protein
MSRWSKPEPGDLRYFVEYLDVAQGIAAIKAGGGDAENDTMWDYCSQDEITCRIEFTAKFRAVAWARRNKKLDVFNMPRVVEETYQERPADNLHNAVRSWEQTGYWETDGTTEIEPS